MELFIAVAVILMAFYLMAVLTEGFFVPSIDKIAHKFKLSSDASGATLLAMGSSAPEFFTSFFAILGLAGGGHTDIGAGTIVGSAIFNVLVIVGAAAMFRAVKLQWQPVIRDLVFYGITIIMLLAAFWDGQIFWYEALGFVLMYGVYVFTVVKWRKWLKYDDIQIAKESVNKKSNQLTRAVFGLIAIFVPNPATKPHLFFVTFIVSIGVIAGLSWVLVDQVVVIAETLHINPTFLALTVLAAGTSVPDLIGSIVVAKQGRGDMAVSNAIGSNIFDILFCLGIPWLLVLSLFGHSTVPVSQDNLLASILLLLATIIAMVFLLIVRNWRIGHRSGLVLIGLYVAYCIYIAITVA